MRVLVVEDETALADAVARGLRRRGMDVDVAYDGNEGFDKASGSAYDVLVLDRDLPGMSGDDICRTISAETRTRVLMLTASISEEARESGLGLGASDYVTKPFQFTDLVTRINALGDPDQQAPSYSTMV